MSALPLELLIAIIDSSLEWRSCLNLTQTTTQNHLHIHSDNLWKALFMAYARQWGLQTENFRPTVPHDQTWLKSFQKLFLKTHLFKVSLAGQGGTGKSSFHRAFASEEDRRGATFPTGRWVEYHTISFRSLEGIIQYNKAETKSNRIRFTTGDVCGSKWNNNDFDFYRGVDAVFLFFEVDDRMSYKNVAVYYQNVIQANPDPPLICCIGNKVDLPLPHKIKDRFIRFPHRKRIPHFRVSVLAGYNTLLPFEWVASTKLDKDIKLVPCFQRKIEKEFNIHTFESVVFEQADESDEDI